MTTTVKVGKLSVWLAGTGLKPELKPPSLGEQGPANEVWTTEWFLGWKWKMTWSPASANWKNS